MPSLSIIPSKAASDAALTAADLRVLLAIGAHTDRYGANVWASARTLSGEARVSRAQFFASASRLQAQGYIRRTTRYSETGRQLTSMYEVCLDAGGSSPDQTGSVQEPVDGDCPVASGHKRPLGTTPLKKNKSALGELTAQEQAVFDEVWSLYPPRPADSPHNYVASRKAVVTLLRTGTSSAGILRAARRYAEGVAREGTDPKYVRSITRFYDEGHWETFDVPTVYGMTREEWQSNGRDMAEFDVLLDQLSFIPTQE